MFALLRAIAVALVVLTILRWLLALYARSIRREKLEKAWAQRVAEEGAPDEPEAREGFIEQGMDVYEHSLRRKLLWLVYIIPLGIVALTVYLVNYQ
ncbi:hypothetical protein [Phaeovulum sp. W22_SRMD_FR3]|uniref:hypothetical protein n=1 Tax=Phaeovulum sp. W22_SRMD_FR3 TaxID=3240274 RepID=UPI003F989172